MEYKMDKINSEKEVSSIEFPSLTEKDMDEIYLIYLKLHNKFPEEINGFEPYTGLDPIGKGNIYYNSKITLLQLEYALAMTRHYLIKEIIQSGFDKKLNVKELVKNKIMTGMRILDLGCGPEPVFARCCRAMGADVWTVDKDIIPQKSFKNHTKNFFTQEQLDLEVQKHIQLNLNNENAIDIIKSKYSGEFNLITEANLDSENFEDGENIAMSLLKKGGIYNNLSKYPRLKK